MSWELVSVEFQRSQAQPVERRLAAMMPRYPVYIGSDMTDLLESKGNDVCDQCSVTDSYMVDLHQFPGYRVSKKAAAVAPCSLLANRCSHGSAVTSTKEALIPPLPPKKRRRTPVNKENVYVNSAVSAQDVQGLSSAETTRSESNERCLKLLSGPRSRGGIALTSSTRETGLIRTMERRILPRDNCVTNVLYAKKLPSPPRLPFHNLSNSSSMSMSSMSMSSMSVSSMSDWLSVCRRHRSYLCPFCGQTFGFSFGLECHLLSMHKRDLAQADITEVRRCFVCEAKLVDNNVLLRHLLRHHEQQVLHLVLGHHINRFLQDGGLKCPWCEESFDQRHSNLFLGHLQLVHLDEMLRLINNEQKESHLYYEIVDTQDKALNQQQGGNRQQQQQRDQQREQHRHGLSDAGRSLLTRSQSLRASIRNKKSALTRSLRVKRFNRGKSERTKGDDVTSTSSEPPTTSPWSSASSSRSASGVKFQPTWSTQPWSLSSSERRLYGCRLCETNFLENAFLLTHLKNRHRRLTLKQLYTCGACQANFYSNKHLVKHCHTHQLHIVDRKDRL